MDFKQDENHQQLLEMYREFAENEVNQLQKKSMKVCDFQKKM